MDYGHKSGNMQIIAIIAMIMGVCGALWVGLLDIICRLWHNPWIIPIILPTMHHKHP